MRRSWRNRSNNPSLFVWWIESGWVAEQVESVALVARDRATAFALAKEHFLGRAGEWRTYEDLELLIQRGPLRAPAGYIEEGSILLVT